MLQSALEEEVESYLLKHANHKDAAGHQLVVRNGSMPERKILTGAGALEIKQPRINDKRSEEKFSSAILPPYLRKSPSIETLIPALYLKGISTNDFPPALEAILGKNAGGLSQGSIVRLKKIWESEYDEWSKTDLSDKRYVYMWADGIHFNVRLEDQRTCILVIIGTLENGKKELVSVLDGYRESKESWMYLMRELKSRGLKEGPKLAAGDGALGFWSALRDVFPETKEQRCWVHKTANILDKMPKKVQGKAKSMIHEMYMSPTKSDAFEVYDLFLLDYKAKYPKACECLEKDKESLFNFYNFPAEHWQHIRTTNPIESTFATVRSRTKRTKGCGSRRATLAMVYKLAIEAQKRWKKIKGYNLITDIFEGKVFKDGELVKVA
jgi:transposase-like protein